jgi:hypothetical protein
MNDNMDGLGQGSEFTLPLAPILFDKFCKDYWAGKYVNQRFGQAFCNYFDLNDSTLFYMESTLKAKDYAARLYIDYGNGF